MADPTRDQELQYPEQFQGAALWLALARSARELSEQVNGTAGQYAALVGARTAAPDTAMIWPRVMELRPQYEGLRLDARWLDAAARSEIQDERAKVAVEMRGALDPQTLRGDRQALWVLQQAAAAPGRRRPLTVIVKDLDLTLSAARAAPDADQLAALALKEQGLREAREARAEELRLAREARAEEQRLAREERERIAAARTEEQRLAREERAARDAAAAAQRTADRATAAQRTAQSVPPQRLTYRYNTFADVSRLGWGPSQIDYAVETGAANPALHSKNRLPGSVTMRRSDMTSPAPPPPRR